MLAWLAYLKVHVGKQASDELIRLKHDYQHVLERTQSSRNVILTGSEPQYLHVMKGLWKVDAEQVQVCKSKSLMNKQDEPGGSK